ncbi:MAG: hypothetical protein ACFFCW_00605 [Candidatus Hodarchaeota archaeon]
MTDEDATIIIEQVLKAHWPNWIFNHEEIVVWVKELRKYDYNLAKTAVNNFYMQQIKQGKPAPAHLRMALRKNARAQKEKQNNEPILLFEIIKEGRERGQRFFCNQPKPAEQEIENYSERVRKLFNAMYRGNHYVVRQFESLPF